MESLRIASSFRDPCGYVWRQEDQVYRYVQPSYFKHLDTLMACGLYDELTNSELLIPHEELAQPADAICRVLKPTMVPFISYPYEWCFNQLKDAALATLRIQEIALKHGMTLKDASAYNIQFMNGKPLLIDTLSFEKYVEGEPWVAYKQFCEHFLAPLSLMAHCDVTLNQLMKTNISGVPLSLTEKLLPSRAKLNVGIYMHIVMHTKAQQTFADRPQAPKRHHLPKMGLLGLIDSLQCLTASLNRKEKVSVWSDYYTSNNNYNDETLTCKKLIVKRMLSNMAPKTVWDVGGNIGLFSRIASELGAFTLSMDIDPLCVDANYMHSKKLGERNILPLIIDLTAPTPAIGWANRERESLESRGPAEVVLALALIHHLAIGNNVPLNLVAQQFSKLGKSLIIEFVGKQDSQVKRLLASRKDIFEAYTRPEFERAFSSYFDILEIESIPGTDRTMYLMTRK